ncbi:MAG: beta-galactosidase [Chthoniobacteraceae bacterium]
MHRKKWFILGAVLLFSQACMAGENLLRNGDFEDAGNNGLPSAWYVLDEGKGHGTSYKDHKIQFQVDPNIVRHGHYSAAVFHSDSQYPYWVMLRQDLKLQPGDYVITGYVNWARKSFARPCVSLHLIDSKNSVSCPIVFKLWNKQPPSDWIQFWKKFTVTADTKVVGVNILATDGPAQAYVDDVAVYHLQDAPPEPEALAENSQPAVIPAQAGHPSIPGLEKDERIKVVELNGVWYFKSQDGTAFFDLGVNHFSYPKEKSWWDSLNPQRGKEVRLKWPIESEWQNHAIGCLKNWGFSSLGAWSFESSIKAAGEKGINSWVMFGFSAVNNSAYLLKGQNGMTIPVGGTSRMGDPFNPDWKNAVLVQAKSVIEKRKDISHVMGYFPDNEISLGVVPLYAFAWTPSAKEALIKWLSARYRDISTLNKAWTTDPQHKFNYTCFDEIGSMPPDLAVVGDNRKLMADMENFEDFMVSEYVDFVVGAIRKYDPQAIICSPRLPGERLCDYKPLRHFSRFDVVAVNCYGAGSYSSRQIDALQKIHEVTGRPILISEWTVGHGYEGEGRSKAYIDMVKQLSNLPFIVGMHWQMWFTPSAEGNNFGLVDNADSPDELFVEKVSKFQKASFSVVEK